MYGGCVFATGTYGVAQAFSVCFSYSTPGIIAIITYGADYAPTTGKAINDGLWHTVLVTYDGTTLIIYVDGKLDNTATTWSDSITSMSSTMNTVCSTSNFLGQSVGRTWQWSGKLKNVLFYDYVITYIPASLTPTITPTTAINNLLYTSGNYIIC